MRQRPGFIFVTCQVGAERAVKNELARHWPEFRLAYSRPGFLTFKLPTDCELLADFDLDSVFARTYGFSLGKVTEADLVERGEAVWQLYGDRPYRRVHVWQRDVERPGDHGVEPPITAPAEEARGVIERTCPRPDEMVEDAFDPRLPARRGDFVLDCVLVEPNEWWVGYHRARLMPSQWAGGAVPLKLPQDAVSRAWLKMEEALCWSELPIRTGARCAELGSAPGGTTQALLNRGFIVMGIDPAEMHRAVLSHPNFTHVRRRARHVRRRDFRKTRWLMADMNLAPSGTLDVIEDIVCHPEVSIRGILAVLKLGDWKLADRLDEYLARIRGWGFNVVRARQLRHNRQEVCFAALKKPFVRRPYRRKSS
jgi:23S rRNA (cytidine2498-2'-O)-methyltransferase